MQYLQLLSSLFCKKNKLKEELYYLTLNFVSKADAILIINMKKNSNHTPIFDSNASFLIQ